MGDLVITLEKSFSLKVIQQIDNICFLKLQKLSMIRYQYQKFISTERDNEVLLGKPDITKDEN